MVPKFFPIAIKGQPVFCVSHVPPPGRGGWMVLKECRTTSHIAPFSSARFEENLETSLSPNKSLYHYYI